MTYIKSVLLILLFSITLLNATQVYHQLKPGSDFYHLATLGACSTQINTNTSMSCNPALSVDGETSGLHIGMVGKADGDSIDNGKSLIFDPINETLLRKLFAEDSYNSFSMNSQLTFRTPYFTLEYSPYYLVADIFLFNPAFASMSVNIINRETLRLASASELKPKMLTIDKIKFGGILNYYKNVRSNSNLNLVDLGTTDPEDLIIFNTHRGISADLGLILLNTYSFLPDLSFVVKNAGAPDESTNSLATNSEYLFPVMNVETHSTLGIGKNLNSFLGEIHAEVLLPFERYYQAIYTDYISYSLKYSLGLMQFIAAGSEYHYSFGMNFKSSTADVGIAFTKEKDLGNYADNFKDSIYISAVINL